MKHVPAGGLAWAMLGGATRLLAGEPAYQIYDLGTLGGPPYTEATGINDAGTVTGHSVDPENYSRAFVWMNGLMTNIGVDVPEEDGYFSSAWGISEGGVVVGGGPGPGIDTDRPIALFGGGGDIAIWPVPDGCFTNWLPFGISSTASYGVGYCVNSSGLDRPTVYLSKTRETINLGEPTWLPSKFYMCGYALDANDDGIVVGQYYYGPESDTYGFLWSDGVMSEFEIALECSFSVPTAINNGGDMIVNAGDCGTFRYRDGVLEPLSPGSILIGALNERGDAVGYDIVDLSETHPTLHKGTGEFVDLIEFMAPHYIDPVATAINNNGWIVGWAYGDPVPNVEFAWLLVPIYPKGDYDGDEDVDLHDFGHFQRCYAAEPYQGPEGGLHVGCSVFDFDDDVVLDLTDYDAFQSAFTGAITSGW